MPMISGGSGDDMMRLAFQMIAQAQQQRFQQGRQQIETADPGATAGQVGMSPKQFAALFGKDTPFDAGRILKPQTSADVVDQQTRDYLKSLDPAAMLNVVATNMNNRAGVAGSTTMAGVESSRKANENTAKVAEIKSGSEVQTAHSVAAMIDEGLKSFDSANPKTRAAMGQQASLGTTQDAVEQDRLKHQLGAAALREALDAQTNPKAPIHAFLAQIGLNLPTVMAGTALGVENLFDTFSHIQLARRTAGFDAEAAMEKAEIEHAADLSKSVFKGTLTPKQIRVLMSNQEKGIAPPKGMEGAAQLYSSSVSAYFNSALTEALTKNDPFLKSIQQQIQSLQKPGVDPNTLVSVQELSSRAAGYAATLQQIGPQPDDAEGAQKWQQIFEQNVKRVPRGGIHFPVFSTGHSTEPGGLGAEGRTPENQPNVLARPIPQPGTPSPVSPVPGVAPVAGPNPIGGLLTPAAGPSTGLPLPRPEATAAPQLSKDQMDQVQLWLKANGMAQ